LDMFSGLESSYVNELLTKSGELKEDKKDDIQLVKTPYLNTEYLGFNMDLVKTHPALQCKAFRQALNYGIDRVQLLSTLRNGVGYPATSGFFPKGLPAFDPERNK